LTHLPASAAALHVSSDGCSRASHHGRYGRRRGRLQGATQMYMLQNAGVLLSAAAVFPLLSKTGRDGVDPGGGDVVSWVLTVACILCGSAASVGSMGSTLTVERQWVKALCRGDTTALAAMNSGARPRQVGPPPSPIPGAARAALWTPASM